MQGLKTLIIGGGIGGLTAAIALRQKDIEVDLIERDHTWSVYGVGIIQQANVVRAMSQLGLLQQYLDAGFGFNFVEVYLPNGQQVARVPAPALVEGLPANVGVSRKALHRVLGDNAIAAGAKVRLGVTATAFTDDGEGVDVRFNDGSESRYNIVIGADGVYSATRRTFFPEAPEPEFTGQAVWRHNFQRPADMDCLRAYEGPIGVGLVPLSESLMYMYVTTPEPDNPRFETAGLAARMRDRLSGASAEIAALADRIVDDEAVVYKPLDCLFLEGPWFKGRVVLLGDAVHATTPHLGQGAGMAIEDGIVLADELARAATPQQAFEAYQARRYERCRYTVQASREICDGQLGKGPRVDQSKATRDMFATMAQPI